MKKKLLCSTVALLALGLASPASATIVNVVYKGVVTSGYDFLGSFGPALGDLTGYDYKASYVFDTMKGISFSDSFLNAVGGGSLFGSTSPVISAIVTINGYSVSVGGALHGYIVGYNNGNSNYQAHYASEFKYSNDVNDILIINDKLINRIDGNGALQKSIYGPFVYHVLSSDIANGEVYIFHGDVYAYAYAKLTSLTVSPVSTAAPEPSTWAMMLLGFGGLGFAGYRRAKAASAA
jgi:hypothetical protein